jgi:hypothetical protein
MNIPQEILDEYKEVASIRRLVKTGFFCKQDSIFWTQDPYLRLNRTVLDKALVDQFIGDKNFRLQSKIWCDLENVEFLLACERADLEPELVKISFDIITKILIEKGEDKYHQVDKTELKELSDEEREDYLNYEDTLWYEKEKKK